MNWQIDQTKYARDYPIPEYREHTHTYDKYGYCTSDDCSHSPMPSVIENGCHMISNVAQLKAFRDAVKAAAKGTAVNGKLVQDIDFDGYTGSFGEPIGVNETRPYVGEFDGQNHTINAFAMELDNTYHFTGLFGCAGDDDHAEQKAEIRNFRISGSIKSNYVSSEISVCKEAHIGVVARLTNGSVEGVSSSVAFANNACSSAHFGGVVGCSSGSKTPKSISNCQFTGSITADAYNSIGGIVGYSQGNLELVSNYFGGTITLNCTAGNTTYLGGLLGYSGSDGRKWDMYYNVSYGTLTPSAGGTTYQGALFGHTSLLTGSNFAGNYTKIDKSTEEQNIEGIVKDATLTPDEITAKLGIHWCVRDDGITLGTDNIVSVDARKNYVLKYIYIDDKADSLTWKYSNFDKEALSVKVSKVVYVRAAGYMTNDYITTCLPFAMDASSLPGGSQSVVLQYDHMDNGDAMFIPVLDHRCQAGVPYLLKLPDTAKGAEWRIELTGTKGITLIDTVNNPSTASTNIFGAFRTGVINTGYYKLHPDGNRFVKTRSGSHCFPYRAYLNVKAATGTTSVNIETE